MMATLVFNELILKLHHIGTLLIYCETNQFKSYHILHHCSQGEEEQIIYK